MILVKYKVLSDLGAAPFSLRMSLISKFAPECLSKIIIMSIDIRTAAVV